MTDIGGGGYCQDKTGPVSTDLQMAMSTSILLTYEITYISGGKQRGKCYNCMQYVRHVRGRKGYL